MSTFFFTMRLLSYDDHCHETLYYVCSMIYEYAMSTVFLITIYFLSPLDYINHPLRCE